MPHKDPAARKKYELERYARNREKNLAYAKAYRLEHREQVLAYLRKHYAENKPEYRSKMKIYIEQNRERVAAMGRNWWLKNRESNIEKQRARRQPDREKHNKLISAYGISLEDYNAILELQGGGCAVCGQTAGKRKLAVDHCHKTGVVRGLLCGGCNSGLGHLGDSIEKTMKALEYLIAFEAAADVLAGYIVTEPV